MQKKIELMMGILLIMAALIGGKTLTNAVSGKISEQKEQAIVMIDPGHGGFDSGKVGVDGLAEKDLNLAVAKKLQKILTKNGVHVVMSRQEDTALCEETAPNKKIRDMKKRTELINHSKASIAVSIHQNSYQTSDVKGAQVFYFTHSVEGKKAAEILQKHLKTVDETNRREAKPNDTYYILKKTEIPTVIVEAGFLTNPEEAAKLQDEAYQEKIAQAVWEGLKEYLNL